MSENFKEYLNGKYYGELKNGEPHGKGSIFWSNGGKYIGDWYLGKRTGKGTIIYSNGEIYNGEVVDGKREGKGIMYYLNDNLQYSYFGEWRNDERDGYGEWDYRDGRKCKGDWKKGNMHGIVEEFNPISQEWVKSFYENDKKVINKVENEDSGKDEKSDGE